MPERDTVLIEDARIIFRNFQGKEGKYNAEGDRNFCVLLDQDLADRLDSEGWNVKALRAREADDPPQPYLQVSVGYGKGRPPQVVMITSKGRTDLDEESCGLVDWVDIKVVDMIIRPYHWSASGKTGVKAYLKAFWIVLEENYLELKYADVKAVGADQDFVDGYVVDDVLELHKERLAIESAEDPF